MNQSIAESNQSRTVIVFSGRVVYVAFMLLIDMTQSLVAVFVISETWRYLNRA